MNEKSGISSIFVATPLRRWGQAPAAFECGPYAVSVDLPEMADPATLKASLENGILSVAVAKRPETQARRIEIA